MSDNLWGDLSGLDNIKNPLDILKEQSGYLMDATGNIIYADLKNRPSDMFAGEPDTTFVTVFSIQSKMLDKYEFQLLSIHYNIGFYPMIIILDDNVRNEIDADTEIQVDNENEFKSVLRKALDNNHTKKIIGGIYVMSK